MREEKKTKKSSWLIILFIISIILILFLWVRKDIANILTTMPKEQVFPLILTSLWAALLKIAIIVIIELLIKLIFVLFKKKGE